jgi:crotonobetainyl-CoA:carnitine CoA-transferase CaiB-like acyl-CoA transferase
MWQRAPHPVMGEVTLMAPPFLLSETPARVERGGPLLGEHNEPVFRDLLGIPAEEYAAFAREGVFA